MFDKLLELEPKFKHTYGVSVRIIHVNGEGGLIDWLIDWLDRVLCRIGNISAM